MIAVGLFEAEAMLCFGLAAFFRGCLEAPLGLPPCRTVTLAMCLELDGHLGAAGAAAGALAGATTWEAAGSASDWEAAGNAADGEAAGVAV